MFALDGSGIIGLTLERVRSARIEDSRLEHNHLSALQVLESTEVHFEDLVVTDNVTVFDLLVIHDSQVEFNRARIEKNQNEGDLNPETRTRKISPSVAAVSIRNSKVAFVDSIFRENNYARLFDGRPVRLTKTLMQNNVPKISRKVY